TAAGVIYLSLSGMELAGLRGIYKGPLTSTILSWKADITRCDGRATQHGSRITGGPQSLLSGTRENRKDPPVSLQEDGKMTSLNISDERGEERQECEKNGRRVVIGAFLTTAEVRLIQVIQGEDMHDHLRTEK
ncbi:hypothetical protein G0U57_010061, partial [Chelydra serpentina]